MTEIYKVGDPVIFEKIYKGYQADDGKFYQVYKAIEIGHLNDLGFIVLWI